MEDTELEELEEGLGRLQGELKLLVERIRGREVKEAARWTSPAQSTPTNVFHAFPGPTAFKYIVVPKEKAPLCFGSRSPPLIFPRLSLHRRCETKSPLVKSQVSGAKKSRTSKKAVDKELVTIQESADCTSKTQDQLRRRSSASVVGIANEDQDTSGQDYQPDE